MNEVPVGAGCAKALTRQSYQPAPRPPKGYDTLAGAEITGDALCCTASLGGVSEGPQ